MHSKILWSLLALLTSGSATAQSPASTSDTLQSRALREINVRAERSTIERLPQVSGTYLWSGK